MTEVKTSLWESISLGFGFAIGVTLWGLMCFLAVAAIVLILSDGGRPSWLP